MVSPKIVKMSLFTLEKHIHKKLQAKVDNRMAMWQTIFIKKGLYD
jgi:hypothetical protein